MHIIILQCQCMGILVEHNTCNDSGVTSSCEGTEAGFQKKWNLETVRHCKQ